MSQPLLCVIAFCGKDAHATEELLKWIEELGGCQNHHCLLVADNKVEPRQRAFIKMRAESCFASAEEIEFVEPPLPEVLKWPPWRFYANQMFLRAAEHIFVNYRLPFLWLEADAVPMRMGWLDTIANSYYGQPKRFHGPIIIAGENRPAHWPEKHMAGVAVYPMTAVHVLRPYCGGEHTWDLGAGNDVVPKASKCRLIQHSYGPSEEDGWTFEARDGKLSCTNSTNGFAIREDAVLFHRCKDGSLIRALRELKAIEDKKPKLPGKILFTQGEMCPNQLPQDDSQITSGGIVNPAPPRPEKYSAAAFADAIKSEPSAFRARIRQLEKAT